MKHVIHEDTWPFIDEFFREIPDAMFKLPTVHGFITENIDKGVREGIEKEIKKRVQESNEQKQQKTLIRQLKLKFGDLPQSVVDKIYATHDDQRLDQWLDQVIFVKQLEDMEF